MADEMRKIAVKHVHKYGQRFPCTRQSPLLNCDVSLKSADQEKAFDRADCIGVNLIQFNFIWIKLFDNGHTKQPYTLEIYKLQL